MIKTTAQDAYPDGISRDQLFVAFGNRTIPQLIEQLDSTHPLGVREHALNLLSPKLHKPEDLDAALYNGLLDKLREIFVNSSAEGVGFLKFKSLEAVNSISKNAFGRSSLLSSALMPYIYAMLDDNEPEVRRVIYEIFLYIVSSPKMERGDANFTRKSTKKPKPEHHSCAQQINVDFPQFISTIIETIPKALPDEQTTLLSILGHLLSVQPKETSIFVDAVKLLHGLIDPTQSSSVLAATCHCISVLCRCSPVSDAWDQAFNSEMDGISKTVALVANDIGITKKLLEILAKAVGFDAKFLGSDSLNAKVLKVKTVAVVEVINALMAISTDVEAKRLISKERGVEMLQAILNRSVEALFMKIQGNRLQQLSSTETPEQDLEPKLLISTMQLICMLAEEYKARLVLQSSVPILKTVVDMSRDSHQVVTAKQAIKVITWRP